MSDPKVIHDILQILNGENTQYCILSPSSKEQKSAEQNGPFLLLSVWGDTRLSVYDTAGNYTGVTLDGWIVNEIPGASFDPGEGGTFLVLPITTTYSISLEQHSNIPLQIEVTDLRAADGEEAINPYERATFIEIPSVISGTATMLLDYSTGLDSLQLLVDLNNDGLPEQTITPTAILEQQGIQDITPPTTTISIEGNQDAQGFYTGLVTVTLSVQDGPEGFSTGVYKTEYSLDGGQSWLTYTGPTNFIAETVPEFKARSVDYGGNQEYPLVSKRLRAYAVTLPVILK